MQNPQNLIWIDLEMTDYKVFINRLNLCLS